VISALSATPIYQPPTTNHQPSNYPPKNMTIQIKLKPFLHNYVVDFAVDVMGTDDINEAVNQILLDHKRNQAVCDKDKESDEDMPFSAVLEGTKLKLMLLSELNVISQSPD
jgi:hypothetical protein